MKGALTFVSKTTLTVDTKKSALAYLYSGDFIVYRGFIQNLIWTSDYSKSMAIWICT